MRDGKIEFLKVLALFEDCTRDDLMWVAANGDMITADAGTVLASHREAVVLLEPSRLLVFGPREFRAVVDRLNGYSERNLRAVS